MKQNLTNRLSIYLIKEEYTSTKNKELVKNCEGVDNINKIGEFHYGYSRYKPPHWLEKFFGESFDNYKEKGEDGGQKLFSATASGVLFIDIKGRKFAITFGYGRMFLNDGVYEERFGLKSVLGLIKEDNFRALEKKNMSREPKLSREQVSRNGDIYNFGIDIEQDLLLGITGKSSDESFGNIVTGKDALSISVKYNINNIENLLSECLKLYNSEKYKNGFSWIDHISPIKSKNDINKLDEALVKRINNKNFDALWMSIPDIIQWDNLLEFRFNKKSFGDDIKLEKYLSFLRMERFYHSPTLKNIQSIAFQLMGIKL